MKRFMKSMLNMLLLTNLCMPVFASNYVDPPVHPIPDDEQTPVKPPTVPETGDVRVLPVAIGAFIAAGALAAVMKKKSEE